MARVNKDGTITTTSSRDRPNTDLNGSMDGFNSDDGDEFALDDDDDYGNGTAAAENGDSTGPKMVLTDEPGTVLGTVSRTFSKMVIDMSGHSNGLGSTDRRSAMAKQFNSMRSILSMDIVDFQDDNRFVRFLRYIRVLAPHPNEKPLKKWIRILTWVAMTLDLTAAIVAITTYSSATTCCGDPILSIAGSVNWTVIIRVTTYIYLCLILLEIVPVVRDGFPINLLNPMIGFLITFAVFFDDSIVQAAVMWSIEATAVFCEFVIFRIRSRVHRERNERLNKTEQEIKSLRKVKKKVKKIYDLEVSKMSLDIGTSDDDDSILQDNSFHDETESGDAGVPTDISNVRELRLLRERRFLRNSQNNDRVHLRYHMIGVAINIFLVCVSLLLIIAIGRNGGLCIVDMEGFNVFSNNQLERCFQCQGTSGTCEICNADGTSQCYYPYGWDIVSYSIGCRQG
jgi:hypothetical protein